MEEILLYTSISLITLFFLYKLFLQNLYSKNHKNLPPSPPALPIIGHLHLLKIPLHRTLRRLAETYGGGNGVISLRFGSRHVVVISSLPAAEECFTKNDVVLANRPPLLMSKHLGYNFTTVTSSPYGDHWRNLRRIAAIEIFSSARLKASSGIWRDEIRRLLARINWQNSLGQARVELRSLFTDMMFNMVMRMVAGKRYFGDDVAVSDEAEASRFKEIMREIASTVGAANPGDFLPILNWFSNSYEKKVKSLAKKTDEFLQGLIDEHRGRESKETMIDHLLSLQESQPEYYTDEIIKGFMLVIILGGTDTISVTLEWAMSNLLNHPNILKKAKAELDSQVGHQALVDEQDLSKLHYLQTIIFETLRLHPAAPLLLPHYSSANCTVGGHDVPRGTIVLVNAWAMQRDPRMWDDAESFKPERFEELAEEPKLMAFGLGRRACPGDGLAQRVLGLSLGALIQCFEWGRVSEEEVDMSEGKGITMPKVVPLEAKCKANPIVDIVLSKSA